MASHPDDAGEHQDTAGEHQRQPDPQSSGKVACVRLLGEHRCGHVRLTKARYREFV